MYEQKLWQDHVTEFEDRYTESRNDDGTITHTPVEGEIIQQGTPQNATITPHTVPNRPRSGLTLTARARVGILASISAMRSDTAFSSRVRIASLCAGVRYLAFTGYPAGSLSQLGASP